MLTTEIERTRSKRPEDLNAYDLYLRAHPEFQSYSREGFLRALGFLEKAVTVDQGSQTRGQNLQTVLAGY